jgi:hypothetical protein
MRAQLSYLEIKLQKPNPQKIKFLISISPKNMGQTHSTHLTTIFRNEFVLLHRLLNEGAPSGHIGGSQQQVLGRGRQASDDKRVWVRGL